MSTRRVEKVAVSPSQARVLVGEVLAALDAGDAPTARCYAATLAARLDAQRQHQDLALDEAVRTEELRHDATA
jgi:hypothetical protein